MVVVPALAERDQREEPVVINNARAKRGKGYLLTFRQAPALTKIGNARMGEDFMCVGGERILARLAQQEKNGIHNKQNDEENKN